MLDEMGRLKTKIDELILERLLPKPSPIQEIDLLYRMQRDYPERPAKGLRPLLCVTTCRAFGGAEDDALLTAACIEILHNWVLIHDDIEDASELRRGEPALHRKYDEPLAINAGDALHARMWGCLLGNRERLGAQTCLQIMEEFSRMVNATTEGQHMELAWVVGKRWDLDESDYLRMVGRKTAWYTVTGPCRLGAIIASAEVGDLEKLVDFGLKLGVGFQIQDDILNLVGDASTYGKEKAGDLFEGKRTLMLLKLLSEIGGGEKKRVTAILDKGRTEKTDDDVQYVFALMERHGTVSYARQKAKALLNDALHALGTIGWSGDHESVELLRAIATFSIQRQS